MGRSNNSSVHVRSYRKTSKKKKHVSNENISNIYDSQNTVVCLILYLLKACIYLFWFHRLILVQMVISYRYVKLIYLIQIQLSFIYIRILDITKRCSCSTKYYCTRTTTTARTTITNKYESSFEKIEKIQKVNMIHHNILN